LIGSEVYAEKEQKVYLLERRWYHPDEWFGHLIVE
jgi:hypothetical protein